MSHEGPRDPPRRRRAPALPPRLAPGRRPLLLVRRARAVRLPCAGRHQRLVHRSGPGARPLVAVAVRGLHMGDDGPTARHAAAVVAGVRRGRPDVAGESPERAPARRADPRAEQGRSARVPGALARAAAGPLGLFDRRQRADPHRAVRAGQRRPGALRRAVRAHDDLHDGGAVRRARRRDRPADGGRVHEAGHRRPTLPVEADRVRSRPVAPRAARDRAAPRLRPARPGAVPRTQGQGDRA